MLYVYIYIYIYIYISFLIELWADISDSSFLLDSFSKAKIFQAFKKVIVFYF